MEVDLLLSQDGGKIAYLRIMTEYTDCLHVCSSGGNCVKVIGRSPLIESGSGYDRIPADIKDVGRQSSRLECSDSRA